MLQHIFQGILIGLGAAMPLGPVNVEIARRTLRGGFLAGLLPGAGACTVDVLYAVLTTLSVGRFLNFKFVYWPLSIGAIILLSYLGVQCLRSAWQNRAAKGDGAQPGLPGAMSLLRGYMVGFSMTLLNPMTIAFWFVALPAIAGPVERSVLPLTCMGVFAGTISWVIAFSGTLSILGRFRPGVWMRWADAFGGITLIGFAVAVFLRSIHAHL